MKKTNLKTFKHLKKVVNVQKKDKLIPLKMDRTLFARMALIAQFRKIDMKEVFSYPLGPLPWAIADPYGMPRKTNKAQLLHQLEKGTAPGDQYPEHATSIYDGMAVLQKYQPPSGSTFRTLAQTLLQICSSHISRKFHVVFDVYRDVSIKNPERSKRSAGSVEGIRYKNILPSYPIKSWKKLMSIQSNKTEIVKFLVSEWKKPEFTAKLEGKIMYVTEGSSCWRIKEDSSEIVPELECSHEEADTRMLLHAKYANGPVVIHADDTDVFILLLGHCNVLANMHMKIGKGSQSRIIDINKVKAAIASKLHAKISCQEFCRSLIGMHAFTGCDSVSALAGKGKSRALKLLMANSDYVAAFSNLGNTWLVSADLLSKLEEFVCSLYGKRLQNVDLLCYQLYCSKGGKLNQKLYRHANQLLHYM